MRHLIEGVEGFQQQRFSDHRPVRCLPVVPVNSLSTYARMDSAGGRRRCRFLLNALRFATAGGFAIFPF
jgi:hypothetical protein